MERVVCWLAGGGRCCVGSDRVVEICRCCRMSADDHLVSQEIYRLWGMVEVLDGWMDGGKTAC